MATLKFACVLGVTVLLGVVMVRADNGSGEGDSSEERGRCYCQASRRGTSCAGVTGSQVLGCPNTNSFRQCTGTVCAVQACQTGQVWNFIKNACSACDAGKKVSTDLQVCVCNDGTTLNRFTGACDPCPTASVQGVDRCSCPTNLALDTKNNACKACPAEAPLGRDRMCVCTDNTLFFNQDSWTCVSCPGTLVAPRRGYGRSSCRCTGANQIFYQKTASCFTCPAGTTADRDNDGCDCARYSGQEFNYATGACACRVGYTPNAAGVCTISTATPTNP